MIEAGVTAGLTRAVSRELVVGTLLGSARMMAETGEDPAELRSAVDLPGRDHRGGGPHPRVQGGPFGVHRGGGGGCGTFEATGPLDGGRPGLDGDRNSWSGRLLPLRLRDHRRIRGDRPRRPAPTGAGCPGHRPRPSDPTLRCRGGGGHARACAPYLGSGVVLAVVDPGVGTDRRGVAVETAGGGPRWLVGPDNGLLLPLAGARGGVSRASPFGRRPPTPERPTPTVARTFDGRDLFAPAAAHLVTGEPPMELGNEVDPASLAPGVGGAGGADEHPGEDPRRHGASGDGR